MMLLIGIRVLLALLVAVLLPLGQAHCALTMPHPSAPTAIRAGHEDGDDHDCCPESSTAPASPADPCCCDLFQVPPATAPASISVDTPTSMVAPLARLATAAVAILDPGACGRLEPDARSGSPPDPSSDPQSPRSPPHSA